MAEQNWNKLIAQILGAVLVLVGILGFFGGLVIDGNLLGIFAVTTMHNIIHLLTGGVLLIGAMMDGGRNARMVNLVLGVVYILVTVIGFVAPSVLDALGVATNLADHLLHLALGVVLLGVAFMMKEDRLTTTSRV